MHRIQIETVLSDTDRQALIQGVVDQIRPLLESRPELVGSDTMSRILGISPPTLERLRRSGRIPSIQIGSRRLFRPTDVLEAIQAANKKGADQHDG